MSCRCTNGERVLRYDPVKALLIINACAALPNMYVLPNHNFEDVGAPRRSRIQPVHGQPAGNLPAWLDNPLTEQGRIYRNNVMHYLEGLNDGV